MVEIALSKRGRLAGQYTAYIDDCDRHLADLNWNAMIQRHPDGRIRTVYVIRYPNMLLSRVILGVTDPAIEVDHIDGDGLHCWRDNLRTARHDENGRNLRKRSGESSVYKGVCWTGKKWRAYIYAAGKRLHLGMFDSEREAAIAYNEASKQQHGSFSNINSLKAAA